MAKVICENCGKECFGFWKYPPSKACSLACFRTLIKEGKVSKIGASSVPELGMKASDKSHLYLDKK